MRKIKTRDQFLLNESIIKYSNKFLAILSRIFKQSGNEIAGDLIEANERDFDVANNYIDTGEGEFITFTPDKKAQKIASELMDFQHKEIFSMNRQPMKINRFVKVFSKSIGKNYTDKQIEEFGNLYKSAVENENDFRLIKGEEIAYWYNAANYEELKGTLGNSCMRYRPEDFFDVYAKNPDKVSLLILMGLKDPMKIRGRALVWEIDWIEGVKSTMTFMDRVYYTDEHILNLFRQYAHENGWAFKYNNDFSNVTQVVRDGEKSTLILATKLENVDFSNYPYMDTMKFLSKSSGDIGNVGELGDYYLGTTDGGYDIYCEDCDSKGSNTCDYCEGDGLVECPECEGRKYVSCGICGGTHEIECPECEGSRKESCQECNGLGEIDDEDCDKCEGFGEIDCDSCRGSGNITCDECDRDGEVTCENCRRGKVTCPECDGAGQFSCSTCEEYR